MLLVHGGALDPNIQRIIATLARMRVPHVPLLTGPERTPSLSWSLDDDMLACDGAAIAPSAVFLRYNVFLGAGETPEPAPFRAQAWYSALQGWITSHPEVRIMNRGFGLAPTNKPEHLVRARALGLSIPRTVIGNDVAALRIGPSPDDLVAKPVAGGGYTHTLAEALADFPPGTMMLPAPAIVQERLVAPEIRIFLVGEEAFAFEVASRSLDYREAADTTVRAVPVPDGIVPQLSSLARSLGLDYCAADFKTHPESGALVFLEINSQPMFARFDHEAGGRLCEAMVRWLTGRHG